MSTSLPGARLHTWLRQWASATVFHEVVEPAIADLQYEASLAPTIVHRRQVVLRGYVAIGRALVVSIDLGSAIRAACALAVLFAVGVLMISAARGADVDRRLLNSALLAPGMVAPVILRALGTTSWRSLFAGSLLVAALTLFVADLSSANGGRVEWFGIGRALVLLAVVAPPMAAAAAIGAGPRRAAPPQRVAMAVSFGSGIATVACLLARWPHGQQISIGLALTPFYVALFTALFGLTLLPLLFVARRFTARPALLALVGLVCSPAPLIAGAYLDHRTLAACLDALRQAPLSFAMSSLPFVVGASAIGWWFPPSARLLQSSRA